MRYINTQSCLNKEALRFNFFNQKVIQLHKQEARSHLSTAKMICANGSTIKGLDKKETKIKCDASSGTPRWVLFQTGGKLPKCLKACTSHDDCNMNNYINKEDGYVTISNTSLHEKSLKAYTIPPSTSNTNNYTQYDCKQTSHGGKTWFLLSVCIKMYTM